MKKLAGFKLIKNYPGCNKPIGYFEKVTDGSFLKYPHLWEPIYITVNIEEHDQKYAFIDRSIADSILRSGVYSEYSKQDIKNFICVYNTAISSRYTLSV